MRPLVERQGIFGSNLECVPRPKMDQAEGRDFVLKQQFVAPTAGIGPRPGSMKHHRAILLFGRLHPEAKAERAGPIESAGALANYQIVAAEFQGLTHPALD